MTPFEIRQEMKSAYDDMDMWRTKTDLIQKKQIQTILDECKKLVKRFVSYWKQPYRKTL